MDSPSPQIGLLRSYRKPNARGLFGVFGFNANIRTRDQYRHEDAMNENRVFDDRHGCYIELSLAETRARNLGVQALAWIALRHTFWSKEFARDAAHYAILALGLADES